MKKRRIVACMKCGSNDITSMPGGAHVFMDGTGLGPVGGMIVCRKCGNAGMPVEFAERKAYLAFLRTRKTKRND